MARDAAFNAAKEACTILGTFYSEVSRELGSERATELYGRYGDGFGEMLANLIREYRGDRKATKKIAARMREMYEGLGLSIDMEVSQNAILVRSHDCPVYAGLLAAGLEHGAIETMCRSAVASEQAAFERLLPEGKVELTRFRNAPDDYCVEEFKLA